MRSPRPADAARALYRELTGRPPPPALVVRWGWWWRGFRGLTLGPLVLVDAPEDPVLVCHELCHVAQFYRQPLSFYPRYLYRCWRVGYRANAYEREAFALSEAARAALTRAPKSVPVSAPVSASTPGASTPSNPIPDSRARSETPPGRRARRVPTRS